MRFAIRDDDTNYYTSPEEIMYCYQSIWNICPPSLSLIPFVQGHWRDWQDKYYKNGFLNEWPQWEADSEIFPVGKNVALTSFLKKVLQENKICITIHGINHRNKDQQKTIIPNNFIHYAEFYTQVDLTNLLTSAITYLQELFQTKIKVFTPPQNILTIEGYNAIKANGLNLVGGSIPFIRRSKDLYWAMEFLNVLRFKIRYSKKYYPYVLKLGKTNELMVHYPLQEVTSIDSLKADFDFVYRLGGDFVLSTHYHGFPVSHKLYKRRIVKDIFDEFFEYVQKHQDVKYCSLNDMLK